MQLPNVAGSRCVPCNQLHADNTWLGQTSAVSFDQLESLRLADLMILLAVSHQTLMDRVLQAAIPALDGYDCTPIRLKVCEECNTMLKLTKGF